MTTIFVFWTGAEGLLVNVFVQQINSTNFEYENLCYFKFKQ